MAITAKNFLKRHPDIKEVMWNELVWAVSFKVNGRFINNQLQRAYDGPGGVSPNPSVNWEQFQELPPEAITRQQPRYGTSDNLAQLGHPVNRTLWHLIPDNHHTVVPRIYRATQIDSRLAEVTPNFLDRIVLYTLLHYEDHPIADRLLTWHRRLKEMGIDH